MPDVAGAPDGIAAPGGGGGKTPGGNGNPSEGMGGNPDGIGKPPDGIGKPPEGIGKPPDGIGGGIGKGGIGKPPEGKGKWPDGAGKPVPAKGGVPLYEPVGNILPSACTPEAISPLNPRGAALAMATKPEKAMEPFIFDAEKGFRRRVWGCRWFSA